MPPGIGHNRGQPPLARHLERDHPDVQAVLQEIERLRDCARADVGSAIRRLTQTDLRRFKPSSLQKCPRDRKLLRTVFLTNWAPAIEKRMPQLRRLARKLSRICPEFHATPMSEEQLLEPFHYSGADRDIGGTAL